MALEGGTYSAERLRHVVGTVRPLEIQPICIADVLPSLAARIDRPLEHEQHHRVTLDEGRGDSEESRSMPRVSWVAAG